MEAAFIVRKKLDLVIRLLDTTTGATPDGSVRFYKDGKIIPGMDKGDGTFAFVNLGREDFPMHIEVDGYEPSELNVHYEEDESAIPMYDVFLMPSENVSRGGYVLSFSGKLPKITSIEAVSLVKPVCTISDYDKKERIITLFLPNRRIVMEGVHYGLVHESEATYEKFEVESTMSPVTVRIKNPLEQEYLLNSPISRIVFGKVDKKGNFALRVRDDGSDLRYLVRYEANGNVGFQEVDFHHLEGVKLKRLAARKKDEEKQE